jgi:PhzF family phenazine biosynthesis protein
MRLFTVDTFTNKPFSGNPAGVCLLEYPLEDEKMQQLASELNYSETAFVLLNQSENVFELRWFTPTQEVDICGHATLASTKILYEYNYASENKSIIFNTKSGKLTTYLSNGKIEMNFPVQNIQETQVDDIILSFLSHEPLFVGIDKHWCLIELQHENMLSALKPNFELLKKHHQKIFILTAHSPSGEYDFVSRCLAPSIGIDEDPVTGSAHCYLAPYWAAKLKKNRLIGHQISRRQGKVVCELLDQGTMLLIGECVIMSEIKQNWFH